MKKVVLSLVFAGAVGMALPATAAPPAGDAALGKKAFIQCQACHTVDAKSPDRLGPSLFRIVDAKVASKPGYAYSTALKATPGKWDEALLDRWLTKPGAVAQGTKMVFVGIPDPKRRADLVAYLKTLK